jgi:hypothetical protein
MTKKPWKCSPFARNPGRVSWNRSVNIGPAPGEGEQESRLLLRFAAPRDPVMVAEWVSFNVIDTERQEGARPGCRATGSRQHLRMPPGHVVPTLTAWPATCAGALCG